MIKGIFAAVAQSLLWIGNKFGLTYNEVNILVYYLLIPLSWCILFDCWLGLPITTFALVFRLDWNIHCNPTHFPGVVRLGFSRFR